MDVVRRRGRPPTLPPALERPCARPDCALAFTPPNWRPEQRFCSRRCQFLTDVQPRGVLPDIRARAARTIGDLLRDRGRRLAPYRKRGGQPEHRTVVEERLGRKLLPGEIVHHEDHDKRNNQDQNLVILDDPGEHARTHLLSYPRCPHGHLLKLDGSACILDGET